MRRQGMLGQESGAPESSQQDGRGQENEGLKVRRQGRHGGLSLQPGRMRCRRFCALESCGFRRPAVSLAAIILIAVLGIGWGDTWDSIRENAGKIQTVQADFVQEKHLPILARPLRSEGRFVFRMPDALRWEYTSPVQSVLLLHEGEARRFLPDGEGGWVRDETARLESMGVVLGEITNWLNGRFDENPDFTAELAPDRRIVLTPKSESLARIISRIVLALSETPGLMESVTIHEGPESFTRIVFPEPELNPQIDERVFRAPEAPEPE